MLWFIFSGLKAEVPEVALGAATSQHGIRMDDVWRDLSSYQSNQKDRT
jgi:hypothetical protein